MLLYKCSFSMAVGGITIQGLVYYCVVVTLGQTNSGCIIEGGLLTQVQTHAMETLEPINLAVS